jgi:hypothetical protein
MNFCGIKWISKINDENPLKSKNVGFLRDLRVMDLLLRKKVCTVLRDEKSFI